VKNEVVLSIKSFLKNRTLVEWVMLFKFQPFYHFIWRQNSIMMKMLQQLFIMHSFFLPSFHPSLGLGLLTSTWENSSKNLSSSTVWYFQKIPFLLELSFGSRWFTFWDMSWKRWLPFQMYFHQCNDKVQSDFHDFSLLLNHY